MPFLYDVLNVKPQLYAKGLVWSRGGGGGGESTSVKLFSISYVLNSKNSVFDPYFLKMYWSNAKNTCEYNSRVKITIFLMKNSIFFETFF